MSGFLKSSNQPSVTRNREQQENNYLCKTRGKRVHHRRGTRAKTEDPGELAARRRRLWRDVSKYQGTEGGGEAKVGGTFLATVLPRLGPVGRKRMRNSRLTRGFLVGGGSGGGVDIRAYDGASCAGLRSPERLETCCRCGWGGGGGRKVKGEGGERG